MLGPVTVMTGGVEKDMDVIRAEPLAPELLAEAGCICGNGLQQRLLVLDTAAEHARDRTAFALSREGFERKARDTPQFVEDPLAGHRQSLPDRARVKVAQIRRALDAHGLELPSGGRADAPDLLDGPPPQPVLVGKRVRQVAHTSEFRNLLGNPVRELGQCLGSAKADTGRDAHPPANCLAQTTRKLV